MDPLIYVERLIVDEAAAFAALVFRLTQASTQITSVQYQTSNGTAEASWDYTGRGLTTLTFAPGETQKIVQIALLPDTTAESIEHLWINLQNASGLVIAAPWSLVSIIDNDRSDRAPIASVDDISIDESNGLAKFTILLDRASNVPVTVSYRTLNDTATAGSDYQALTGSVTFAPGQTAKTISVTILNDAVAERAESFFFELTGISGVGGAQLGARRAVGTIGLSDGPAGATPVVTIDPITVSEGDVDGVAEITVRLSARSTTTTSVEILTSNGTAEASWDYHGRGAERLVFAPGETVKTYHIPIYNDATVENLEQFWVALRNPVGLVVDAQWSLVSIIDNDRGERAPIAWVDDVAVDESDGYARFVIGLDRASTVPVTVSYRTVNESATAGADYRAATGSVTFAPGETAKTIAVQIMDDTLAERAETFAFELTGISGVSGAQLGARRAVGTIGLSDGVAAATPFVTIDPITVSEGDPDGVVEVTVRLSARSTTSTSVELRTTNGEAEASWDYAGRGPDRLVFAPGETVKTYHIPIYDDASVERTEHFWVGLQNAVGLTISEPWSLVTIIDNDSADRPPVVSVSDVRLDEIDGFARFVISLDRAATVPFTVSYETVNGTAGASDFTARSGNVVFNPGDTSAVVAVAVTDDALSEGAETFNLRVTGLAGVTNAAVAKGAGVATISRSDGATTGTPTLSVADVSVSEGAGVARFHLVLDAPSTTARSVVVGTSNGSAQSSWDYLGRASHLVTFAPGETVKTIDVQILEDSTIEAAETFNLNLSSPTGLNLARTTAVATIVNNDPSQVSVAAVNPQRAEGNSAATTFTFVIDRSGVVASAQSVNWSVVAEGTNAADFQGNVIPSGTVAFAANQTRQTVVVRVVGDQVEEGNEAFSFRLSNPSNGLVIANQTARSIILNDDTTTVITGTNGADTLTGTGSANVIRGVGGADILFGLGGSDTLDGGAGADQLTGGAGADRQTGGAGADRFIFTALSDSTVALSGRDTVLDFSRAQGDRIDLSAIDANTALAGNQTFTLTPADFTGVAGQISVARWGNDNTVRLDVNGDGVADAAIQVVSVTALIAADFIL